jgi:hypothetical protein
MMVEFKIVTVTNNSEKFPWYDDTFWHPGLVSDIPDDMEVADFVVDERGGSWLASEFFKHTDVLRFFVNEDEAPEA